MIACVLESYRTGFMGPSCDAAPNEYKHSSLVRLLVIDFAVFKAEQTYESKQTTELKEQCYVVK